MKKFLIFWISIVLLGCNSGVNSSNNNGQNPDNPKDVSVIKALSFSNIATIPTMADQQSSVTLLLTNNSDNVIHNIAISLAGDNHSGVSINSKCNADLQSKASCQVNLVLSRELQQGGFILQAVGMTNSGQYTARQLLNYANVKEVNEIAVGEFNNSMVVADDSKITLAIPFRKNNNLSVQAKVDTMSGSDLYSETVCNSDNKQCTELITIIPNGDDEINVSFLDNTRVLATISTHVILNTIGNLITSASNLVISKADGITTQVVQLFNTGYTPVNNVRFSSANPAFSFKVNGCSSIAANSSCSAMLTANSKVNGFGQITVTYDTVNSTGQSYLNNTLQFYASYIAESGAAGFGIDVSGDSFTNNWVGESRNTYLTIRNTGPVKLNSINITPVASQNAHMSISGYGSNPCLINGIQSLESSGASPELNSCVIRVTYKPVTPDAGNLVISLSGKYQDSRDISGTGSISVLSDSVNLNYNSNPRVVYLMANNDGQQNGITRCTLSADGKNLNNCSVTGASGVLNSTQILGLSTFKANNGIINAYLGNLNGGGNFAKCNVTESGDMSNCAGMMWSGTPMSDISGRNVQNAIANINGKNYLYITMWDSDKRVDKCLINSTDGSLSSCVSQANNISFSDLPYLRGITIHGNYGYLFGLNNSNVWICKINQSNGDFYACVKNLVNGLTSPYSSVIKTLGANKYIFISNEDNSNGGSIVRCSVSSSGTLANDCTKILNSGIAGFRGISILTLNGSEYIYYTDKNNSSNIYRRQLNTDGSLSATVDTIPVSGNKLVGFENLIPLIEYQKSRIAYAASNNVYYPNNTYSESLYIAANSNMAATTVALNAPAGISLNPARITFNTSTTSVPISVTIASNVTPGTYTIRGTATNGVIVPDFVINVVSPTINSYTPNSGSGISNQLSTSLNTSNSNSIASITFSQPMSLSAGSINGIKLEYSYANDTYSEVNPNSYSWNISSDKTVLTLVVNSGNPLSNGVYYRVMVNKALLKDLYGNPIQLLDTGYEELTRFRAALKFYITSRTFDGNLGDLNGADAKCNDVNNGKPNDGAYYKAVLAANKNPKSSSQRFPGTNWVLLPNFNYYKNNGSGLTLLGTTDSSGKLNVQNPIINGLTPWSGFNQNWSTDPEIVIGDNYACDNWTVGSDSFTVEGRYSSLNATGDAWISAGSTNCKNAREIVCAQQ